ncbi:MAG: M3 family metallopeptidase [Acidobacteriota bacterium]|nr:M3 family metallopeptidase [Acidobacteriota bacterium]
MKHVTVALLLCCALVISCQRETTSTTSAPAAPATEVNPFFAASTLQYETPPFDRIKDEHYKPALEEGMKRDLAEIERIANNAEAPTFANTIEAMERSGELLTRVSKVFFNMTQANTNEAIQKIEEEQGPKLAAHTDAIYLNPKLFARVKALYDNRAQGAPNAEARFLIEKYHREFVRAGALLSDKDKETLRALNQEETRLSKQFRDKILADTDQSAVVVDNLAELDGLSEADIAAAAEAAKEKGLTNKWVLSLQNTTLQPQLASLRNRALRQRLYEASVARGNRGDANDTKAIIVRLAELRAQRTRLLGFPTYAAYSLDDQMAKNPATAFRLMTDLAPAATARARSEAAAIQKLIDAQGGGFQLQPWDWDFYAEQVRKAEYDLDESQIKPYFEIENVLEDGVFFAANKLYGVSFKERKDLPKYHPDVRTFEVFDADGKSMAIYYADFYARSNKGGGAWQDNFVDQSTLLGKHPVVVNVTNFTKPAQGQPALLSFDNVGTLFHEFGHALHSMMSKVQYPTFSGTSVPRDFGEVPSQFNEHWALEPAVLENYAKHYQTGAPMPQALVDRIKKSSTFNMGYGTLEYLESALLDMAWHSLPEGHTPKDVAAFEKATLKKYGVDVPQVPPRYHTTYFSHTWGGGYSAGYYAYLWSDVIDEDAWVWFKEHGGLTRQNGQRFHDLVMSRGGSQDAGEMYRAFRGRDASVDALVQEKGLR